MNIKLIPLQEHEKETFIRNIQIAFKKAVVEQFGPFDEALEYKKANGQYLRRNQWQDLTVHAYI